MYRGLHSADIFISIDIPSLSVQDRVIAYAQSFKLYPKTSIKPYFSIGGPTQFQLSGGVYSQSLLPTDYFRNNTIITGSLKNVVMKSGGLINSIGLYLILSSANYYNYFGSNDPYLPSIDAKLKINILSINKFLEVNDLIVEGVSIESEQGNYVFENMDFYATSIFDKSI